VVVAMSDYQSPKVPAYADALDPAITQVHSHHYRNPSQLQDGRHSLLVWGIRAPYRDRAARTHPTWIAGHGNGHIPWP